jgi:magnesium transporter
MLKQKIDTAALFAQKKAEVSSSTRTLLTLDGRENAYSTVEDLTEDLLTIPEEGALWLDLSLFGSHDQVMTIARSFKLSPATQNILENRKQQPRLFRDGNNRILICRHLQLNESGNAVFYNNVCFAASANRLLSLQHGRCDRLKNARTLVTTLQKPHNTIPQALTLILGKILDDNCEVINFLEERLQLLASAYSEQDEPIDPKELLRLRRSLVTAKQAVYPMRRIVSRALRQDPPLLIG